MFVDIGGQLCVYGIEMQVSMSGQVLVLVRVQWVFVYGCLCVGGNLWILYVLTFVQYQPGVHCPTSDPLNM